MARLGFGVKVTEEATEQRPVYEDLPDGVYRIEIVAASVDEEGEGTTEHKVKVKTTNEIIEPEEFKGRRLWADYFIQHPSADAQRIGYEKFQRLLRALGIGELPDDADTDELLMISYGVTIGMSKKRTGKDGTVYEPRNEIKRFWYPDQNDMPAVGVKEAAQPKPANDNRPAASNDNKPAAAAGGGKKRPWG